MPLGSSWMDLVVGVDLHMHLVPTPAGPMPTPIPQPFVGMVGDPVGAVIGEIQSAAFSFVTTGQASLPTGPVLINGFPATTIDAVAKNRLTLMHLPMPPGAAHVKTPAGHASFPLGSLNVSFRGASAVRLGEMARSCADPVPLPTSSVIAIPKGAPVMVGGAPGINLQRAAFGWVMGRAIRTAWKQAGRLARYAARLTIARLRNLRPASQCTRTGDPVDVATGRVLTDAVDFRLPGPLPLVFQRNYSSAWSARDGALGPGWSHSLDQAVWREPRTVVYRNAEGQEIVFPLDARQDLEIGREHFEPLSRNTLVRTRSGWKVITADGLIHHFAPIKGEQDQRRGICRLVRTNGRNPSVSITLTYDTRGRLASIKDSAGREIRLEHDDSGRLQRVLLPHPEVARTWQRCAEFEYSSTGMLVAARDALGNSTTYDYDGALLVQRTDRNGLSFYWQYDGRSALARCVRTWGDGGIYNQIIDYDAANRVTVVTDSYGKRTMYKMNALGAVIEVMDAQGAKTVREHDDNLWLTSETDPLGHVTQHRYGPRGQLLATTLPDGSRIVQKYDARFPELTRLFRNEAGAVWRHSYDAHGQLVEIKGPTPDAWRRYKWQDGLLQAFFEPGGQTEVLERDRWSNPVIIRLPNGAAVRREYDRRGRLLASTNPYGARTTMTYDALDRLESVTEPNGNLRRFTYDAEGNVVEARDKAQRLRFTYSGFNNLASREEGPSTGDQPGATTELQWGLEGELLAVLNERRHRYRFSYDSCLRLEREVGFDLQETRYRRDKAGRVVRVEKPKADVHTDVTRDALGRVTEQKHSDGTFAKYVYRQDGALLEATNQTTTVRFERDPFGRVTTEYQGETEVTSEYGGGYRFQLESSLGAKQVVLRDELGNPTRISVGDRDRLYLPEVLFTYDAAGLETGRCLPGGVTADWHRDDSGRPTHHLVTRGGTPAWRQEYAWAPGDRLTELADSRFGTARYEHDRRGRLLAEHLGERTTFRALDEVGNVYRTPDRSDRRYVPGGIIRNDRDTRYGFDLLGNLTVKVESTDAGERVWRYQWDGAGMLAAVTRPDGTAVSFAYDALGRRVSKKVGDTETRWVWDGDVILHELRDSSTTTWYHEPESFTPLAKVENGTVAYHVVSDHLGTPTALYDAKGNAAWQSQLDIYGSSRPTSADATTDCPLRWPGQYADEETGLHYNRFRYYDPGLGEFVSRDPLRIAGGLSLFAYVTDPVTSSDPFGLTACDTSLGRVRLGLGLMAARRGLNYVEWARAHGFSTYGQLSGRGTFDSQIRQAMANADEIHFNLAGVDPSRASGTLNQYREPAHGYTNYELHLIRTAFAQKAVWWDGDVRLPEGFWPF